MKRGPFDCELLGPALVSYVYGEPHPEVSKLLAHLRTCSACRRELDELREAGGWVEAVAVSPELSRALPRRAWRSWLPVSASLGAALLVVAVIFTGSPDRKWGINAPAASGAGPTPFLAAPLPAALSSAAFEFDEIDGRLEAIEMELASIRRNAW